MYIYMYIYRYIYIYLYIYIYTLWLQFTKLCKPDSLVNRISEEKFLKPGLAGLQSNNEINIFGFRNN